MVILILFAFIMLLGWHFLTNLARGWYVNQLKTEFAKKINELEAKGNFQYTTVCEKCTEVTRHA